MLNNGYKHIAKEEHIMQADGMHNPLRCWLALSFSSLPSLDILQYLHQLSSSYIQVRDYQALMAQYKESMISLLQFGQFHLSVVGKWQ